MFCLLFWGLDLFQVFPLFTTATEPGYLFLLTSAFQPLVYCCYRGISLLPPSKVCCSLMASTLHYPCVLVCHWHQGMLYPTQQSSVLFALLGLRSFSPCLLLLQRFCVYSHICSQQGLLPLWAFSRSKSASSLTVQYHVSPLL